jgi:hypothetical protein
MFRFQNESQRDYTQAIYNMLEDQETLLDQYEDELKPEPIMD